MKSFTWDEYYDSFFDWALSTQKNYSRGLTEFGPAEEVFEVLTEFAFFDKKFASQFAEKAMNAGVQFTPEHVLEIESLVERSVLSRMAETSKPAFNREELEEIYMLIDDDAFQRIAEKEKIDIFADEDVEEYEEPIEDEVYFDIAPPQRKVGLLGNLLGAAGIAALLLGGGSKRKKRHRGRCDGDCAHCPPHYGYRYGRWYYGHGHRYGCVYGGNRGDGGMDW